MPLITLCLSFSTNPTKFPEKFSGDENLQAKILSTDPYSSGIDEYADFKTAYFDNLTYNFGANYKGSCGYVAIGMLLSYYDTYLDDSIIPEAYDAPSLGYGTDMVERRSSPGIQKDFISDSNEMKGAEYGFNLNPEEYFSAISNKASSSLHARLIQIGASLGYYDFDNNETPCSLTFEQEVQVASSYLTNYLGLIENVDFEIRFLGSPENSQYKTVKDFVIGEIQYGYPAVVNLAGFNSPKHAAIAYDYDEVSKLIYCNMGWNPSTTHKTPEYYKMPICQSAFSIHFNREHSHTANYGVITVKDGIPETSYHCYDDCGISTYHNSGAHEYTASFEAYDAGRHKAFCRCGAYALRPTG